jgi:hypothetical protein
VALIGVGSGLLYVALAVAQSRLHRATPAHGDPTLLPLLAYATITIVLFALFIALLVVCAKCGPFSRRQRVLAIAFPVVFHAAFLLPPPSLSSDLLSYVSHGYIETTLHASSA